MYGNSNHPTRTVLTLLTGAVAGAVTALLLAPASGEETRRRLRRSVNDFTDDINSTVQDGIDRINSLRGKGPEEIVDEAASQAMGNRPEGRTPRDFNTM